METIGISLDVAALGAIVVAVIGAIFKGHAQLKTASSKCDKHELKIAAHEMRLTFLEAELDASDCEERYEEEAERRKLDTLRGC